MTPRFRMIAAGTIVATCLSLGVAALPGAAGAPRTGSTVASAAAPTLVAAAKRPGAPSPKDANFPVCDGAIGPLVSGISTRCIVKWRAAKPNGSRVTKYVLRIRTVASWNQVGPNVASWKPVGAGTWSAKRVVSRKTRSYIFAGLKPGEYQVKLVAKNAKGTSRATYFVASLDSRGV